MAGGDAHLGVLFARLNDLRRRVEEAGHVLGVPSLVRRRYSADVLGRDLEAGRCGGARRFGRWFIGAGLGLYGQVGHGLAHDSEIGFGGAEKVEI